MTVLGPLTVMGLLTIGAVLVVWFARREWTQFVLAATVAFPQTAALIFDSNGFPLFYLAVVLVGLLSVPHVLYVLARPSAALGMWDRRWGAADGIALALVGWAAIITLAGPRVFAGMPVFAPELGIGSLDDMVPLQPGLGNIAQLGYLTIATAFLLLAGRTFRVDHRLVGATVWIVVVLATVRLVAEPVWPRELLQNMPGFNYATPERLSGTLHEPSVLGLYLVVAATYFVARLRVSPASMAWGLVGLALVAIDFLANNSGTALLGLGIVVAIVVAFGAWRVVRSSRVRVRPWVVVAVLVATAVVLIQLPLVYSMTVGYAADKTQSESFADRGASNLRSWQILLESFGAGVGLGSNRPSSLAFLVLSCLGVIGFGLLLALILLAIRRSAAVQGAGWALVATVIAASVAVPDLSAPLLWVALAVCLTTAIVNPPLNPVARAADTPPVRVRSGDAMPGRDPSVGGTRNSVTSPASPAPAPADPKPAPR